MISALETVTETVSLPSEASVDAMVDPSALAVELRPFQRRVLKWMWRQEDELPCDMSSVPTQNGNPLWYGRGMFHLWPPTRGGFLMHESEQASTAAVRLSTCACEKCDTIRSAQLESRLRQWAWGKAS